MGSSPSPYAARSSEPLPSKPRSQVKIGKPVVLVRQSQEITLLEGLQEGLRQGSREVSENARKVVGAIKSPEVSSDPQATFSAASSSGFF
jgi:hypothetical protein